MDVVVPGGLRAIQPRRAGRVLAGLVVAATVLSACSSSGSGGSSSPATPAASAQPLSLPAPAGAATVTGPGTNWGAGVAGASACNPLGGQSCMLPFPSDYYTVPDPSMPSGRRIAFPLGAMPANASGVHIDPTTWNANDGFSPGSTIEVQVPNLDLATSGIVDQYHVGGSLAAGAPIVLLDATTGRRLAWWAEADTRDPNPATRLLMIHPAADLPEGHRIVVALRTLRTTSGAPAAATGAFADVLAGRSVPGPGGSELAAHLHRILTVLAKDASVTTTGLYLAWDFTVISATSLTGPVVHMRDVAMAALGSGVPTFHVTSVTDLTPSDRGGRTIARQISGTFDVPSFLTGPTGDHTDTLHLGSGGLPSQIPGNVEHAVFSCLVPRSVVADPGAAGQQVTPGRPVLYGKGLFSVATQMDIGGVRDTADHYRLVLCSTNALGLDGNDELADAQLFSDLSNFAAVPDHLQQAMIDDLYLGRLMASPGGFASDPAFRSAGAHPTPFIDTTQKLTYYGNSEGSLIGGAVTAISTEWSRAVLGVPSMNYSILLPRSSDFVALYPFFDKSYPDEQSQELILGLIQMLFDRGETDGYVEQLTTRPLPGTPPHQVLLQMAFGDHQVSNFTTEIEARTIGAVVHRPAIPAGLVAGDPFYGLAAAPASARGPATLYVWQDPHTPPPPLANVPPTAGIDPHDFIPRSLPAAQQQLMGFLTTGTVADACGTGACTTTVTSEVHPANPGP